MNLPNDLKRYRAPRAGDAFQLFTDEQVSFVPGLLFAVVLVAVLLVADVVFR